MERKTKQREIILEELRRRKDHPKADEIYLAVKEKLPRISLGTIYRNLERFREENKVMKIEEENFNRFDGNPKEHPHFICKVCERVFDIEEDLEIKFDKSNFEKRTGFDIDSERVKIYGVCKKCKK
ncbi:MAG: Fur family transcriptional regulator [Minisyncoccales bacterium]